MRTAAHTKIEFVYIQRLNELNIMLFKCIWEIIKTNLLVVVVVAIVDLPYPGALTSQLALGPVRKPLSARGGQRPW